MARVTLKTIATECGVSISTVSLALSGKGKISPDQVEKIREAARKLGYVPNPLLASLASKRFRSGQGAEGNLVALLEFPLELQGRRSTGANYRKDLQQTCRELGYQPEYFNYDQMASYADLATTLYRRGTQGIIISGQPDSRFFEDRQKWSSFCIVQCGRYRSGLPVHTVRPDIFRSIKLIFTQLRKMGYQRIGFGFGRHFPMVEDDESRIATAMAMQEFYTRPKDRVPIYMGDFSQQESFLKWFKNAKPDVVIAFSEAQYYYLKDAGYRIPEDVGFASLHLHLPRPAEALQTGGLEQRRDKIARQSVILMDQLIRHNSRGFPETPRDVLINSEWHMGKTLLNRNG
ncbi:MAG: LacI family DNA-binding transcriptional regulator [Oceanipulchritudo sp.]